ncbi:hypothetical protein FOMPIDRAFT_94695 [Fomitopsis schrenkii]|uniref:Uncharacterized protein n=1 Tax=Fomitopsis schrenkii TaxID=2126942 RepID=S8ECA0_FOMSC|nr:hypothetical protein FOMPIDRAFT_94695 [Fomitopsis schrenkii]
MARPSALGANLRKDRRRVSEKEATSREVATKRPAPASRAQQRTAKKLQQRS